ncbi:helix-turn-helix domain-containing protein [Nocardia sp. NPDC127526]|uniref:helix-turn-helix domain-containing protein n=1 Tax=Nocardia sp. NPDC127526 TaxID=3345393 RepID=UPI00362AF38A
MSRRESETFSIVPHAVLDAMAEGKVSAQAVALYAVIARHAGRDSGQAWPSRTTLARALGWKKADSIDKYLNQLEAAGILKVAARYGNRADAVSDVRDDVHRGRLSSLYTLLIRHAPLPADRGKGHPAQRTSVTPENKQGATRWRGYKQEFIQQESKTRGARPAPAGARPAELPSWLMSVKQPEDASPFSPPKRPLPSNWQPKAEEQEHAQRLGLNFGDLVPQFRELMAGHERSEWDTTFELFINDVAAQRNPATLPMSA